uniref:NADH-ubiquinone oxidoreductase chain 5 n=1 Tax=Paratrioza sinica TaxID=1511640 RepID=A0A068ETY8_9HEMI|nr:NADH dehydrogenase subunit 5 [Paratrioza sinica]AID54944.1 NADH dehydrogenase subunit 5 [Paratrioza sinica]
MKIFSKFNFISFFMMVSSLMIFSLSLLSQNLNIACLYEVELMSFHSVEFNFIIYVDWMCFLFMFVVIFISSLIMLYSKIYMGVECHRFLWVTFMFIFFMLFMIMSPSVLGVLLGWDGLGIVSYCLVIYYKSVDSFNSGFITAATNRLGDSMLILSIVWFSMSSMFMWWEVGTGMGFFTLACMTKSAQSPFSAWLPSAMAAPTPISSLVHSSTLVTAGVYMMIRFYNALIFSFLMEILFIISMVTIFIAGVSALKEFDLKRVVALSTLGQLGFMVLILCVGFPYVAFFHLLIHALFKALLFMCAGAVIHSGGGVQDLRKMGSTETDCFIKVPFNVSVFNLMGLPFTSGFYSKDSLLELTNCSYGGMGAGVLLMMMAMITVSYSTRLLLFMSSFSGWVVWRETSLNLSVSVLGLGIANLMAGSLLNWLTQELQLICLSLWFKMAPVLMICFGLIWHGVFSPKSGLLYMVVSLFYMSSLTKMFSFTGHFFFLVMKLLDQGWFESLMALMKSQSAALSFSTKKMFMLENKFTFSIGVTIIMIMII